MQSKKNGESSKQGEARGAKPNHKSKAAKSKTQSKGAASGSKGAPAKSKGVAGKSKTASINTQVCIL